MRQSWYDGFSRKAIWFHILLQFNFSYFTVTKKKKNHKAKTQIRQKHEDTHTLDRTEKMTRSPELNCVTFIISAAPSSRTLIISWNIKFLFDPQIKFTSKVEPDVVMFITVGSEWSSSFNSALLLSRLSLFFCKCVI